MIYYYDIKIQYTKGKERFYKVYVVSFLKLADFFSFLEKKHKFSYDVISIKEHKSSYNSLFKFF